MPPPRKSPPACPIERTIVVLSGRWKAMILWHLFDAPKRYSDVARLIPAVSQRALTQALRELESDGVIHRDGTRWTVSALGKRLRPTLGAMMEWGETHRLWSATRDATRSAGD
ncbi:MAG: winged helix-turn-helix transcriptional regulator [Tagaea sp.]|nr:helix-turn-helix transcriptional regulator [Azospirillum sp.]MCZ8124571.1 helix-turn-helix domain-containing protein [Magnetospirillum sp.]